MSYFFTYGKPIILFFTILIIISNLKMVQSRKLQYFCILSLLACYYFFRQPRFDTLKNDNIIYASCFGKVILIEEKLINGVPYYHIGTFISLLDPHIQYSPVNGILRKKQYVKGDFSPAFMTKSNKNERLNYHVDTINGRIVFSQIAGTLARTIVSFVKENQLLQQGTEIGLIKMGSRSDVWFPKQNAMINVKVGEQVSGGQSILAFYLK